MTIASLLLGTIASQILFVLVKVFFIGSLDLENIVVKGIYYFALVIITIAVVRRMGILNYVESFFLCAVWLITSLFVDYVVTAHFVGWDIYKTWLYWITLLVIILSVLFFHKALHVQVRKANK
jgi:hypothetical protein